MNNFVSVAEWADNKNMRVPDIEIAHFDNLLVDKHFVEFVEVVLAIGQAGSSMLELDYIDRVEVDTEIANCRVDNLM